MRPRNFWDGNFFPDGKISKEPCWRGIAGNLMKSRLQTIDCCYHLSSEWNPEHFSFTAGNYNFPLVFHLIEKAAWTVEIITLIISWTVSINLQPIQQIKIKLSITVSKGVLSHRLQPPRDRLPLQHRAREMKGSACSSTRKSFDRWSDDDQKYLLGRLIVGRGFWPDGEQRRENCLNGDSRET